MAATETVTVARRILIGMDGSLNANDAFNWYMKHIHQENDYIIIGYCPDISVGLLAAFERMMHANMPVLTNDQLAGEKERVDEIQKNLEQKLTQHHLKGCVQRLSSSNPGHALVKEAEREKVAMVVIGCRGHGTLRLAHGLQIKRKRNKNLVTHPPKPPIQTRPQAQTQTEMLLNLRWMHATNGCDMDELYSLVKKCTPHKSDSCLDFGSLCLGVASAVNSRRPS
ncbi:hypothetical protein RRG08_031077 [Elysia crispata]|uniref:UspA domain-containing protein n=1 Tax=Elysia crispata TaxID=231223 RepID=A0AAE1DFT5_9GAST|nr:hypothetical protein RRG08_031077 [Elysia crispata]